MPELPDVEHFRRLFERHALHRVISGYDLEAPRLLSGIDEATLRENLVGHRFETTHRHGKYLFAQLDHGPWLTLHFGMTGEPRGARGMVKPWLMDQHHLAGIGNIYGDEILFQAGIHPRRKMETLAESELRRIHRAMQETLALAIGAHADPARMPPHFLIPHRHRGGHCPRCHTPLAHTKIQGRTSWYCPRCQPP